jgi:hypothetical protein
MTAIISPVKPVMMVKPAIPIPQALICVSFADL